MCTDNVSLSFLPSFLPSSLPPSLPPSHIPGGIIPHDGVPVEQDVTVAFPLTVTLSILAFAGIVFSVVCLAFNCIFRKKK